MGHQTGLHWVMGWPRDWMTTETETGFRGSATGLETWPIKLWKIIREWNKPVAGQLSGNWKN